MARCSFCGRSFNNAQGVRAHLKTCPAYHARPSRGPLSRDQRLADDERQLERLFGPARASASPTRSYVRESPEPRPARRTDTRPSASPSDNHRAEELRQRQQAQEEAQRRAQAAHQERATRRRAILQQVKLLVIDLHFSWPPVPSPALAEAKLAIERELIKLPLLDLPLMELQQIGTGIRDKIFATYRTASASVPVATTNHITPTPDHVKPKEAAMPMRKILSGYFVCPRCDEEYELDRVPERDAVCEACRVTLEKLEEDQGGDED